MPSVEIPGKIISIEYEDDAVDFEIIELTSPVHGDPRVVIPSGGKKLTIVLATSSSNPGYSSPGFEMDGDFNIGDVVEVYSVNASTVEGYLVFDENGHNIGTSADTNVGVAYRKLKTGSFPTWGRIQ